MPLDLTNLFIGLSTIKGSYNVIITFFDRRYLKGNILVVNCDIMKWRACSVENCKTTEEHACEFRGALIDYQELLLSDFLFEFFPNS